MPALVALARVSDHPQPANDLLRILPLKCSATSKSTGKPRERYAMIGTTVCVQHGVNGRTRHTR
jgi:hypothetical protein